MKKIFLLLFFLLPFHVLALDYPIINSKVVEIYDITDKKTLYEIDADRQTSIASLTKLMTILTAIENIDDLNKQVTITRKIMRTVSPAASVAGLKIGDKVTYKDLLYGAMLPSGTDAVNALAISFSGSIENYVYQMNELRKKIGLENTNYVNVNGLDINNQYSTARDVRKLLIYALENSTFKEIFMTKKYTLSNGLIVSSTLDMYNQSSNLDISKILGSKTGYTKKAGYCLASLVNINGHDMLIVVLNAEHIGTKYYNIVDTVKLTNFLNSNYRDEVLIQKDKVVTTIPVLLSNIDKIDIKTPKTITKFLPTDYDKNSIKVLYKGLDSLDYNNKKNDKIGTISYYYENELLDTDTVFINEDIKIDYFKLAQKYYYIIVIFVIFIIFLILFMVKRKKLKNTDLEII